MRVAVSWARYILWNYVVGTLIIWMVRFPNVIVFRRMLGGLWKQLHECVGEYGYISYY